MRINEKNLCYEKRERDCRNSVMKSWCILTYQERKKDMNQLNSRFM